MTSIKYNFHNFLFGPGESPFAAIPDSGLDAYLVFLPSSLAFPYPSNQSVQGLGMTHAPHMGSDAPGTRPGQFDGTIFASNNRTAAVVYAIYNIFLVDAKTGRVMAMHEGQIPKRYHQTFAQMLWYGAPASPVRYPHPHEYVPDGLWSNTADTLTDAQKQILRDKLTSLFKASIPYSLTEMGLAETSASGASPTATPSPTARAPVGGEEGHTANALGSSEGATAAPK